MLSRPPAPVAIRVVSSRYPRKNIPLEMYNVRHYNIHHYTNKYTKTQLDDDNIFDCIRNYPTSWRPLRVGWKGPKEQTYKVSNYIWDFLPNELEGRRSISKSAPKKRPQHSSPQLIFSSLLNVVLLYSEVFRLEFRGSNLVSGVYTIKCDRVFHDISRYAYVQKKNYKLGEIYLEWLVRLLFS